MPQNKNYLKIGSDLYLIPKNKSNIVLEFIQKMGMSKRIICKIETPKFNNRNTIIKHFINKIGGRDIILEAILTKSEIEDLYSLSIPTPTYNPVKEEKKFGQVM